VQQPHCPTRCEAIALTAGLGSAPAVAPAQSVALYAIRLPAPFARHLPLPPAIVDAGLVLGRPSTDRTVGTGWACHVSPRPEGALFDLYTLPGEESSSALAIDAVGRIVEHGHLAGMTRVFPLTPPKG